MADSNRNDKPLPQKKSYSQNRSSQYNRGRERYDPHVSKALHNFGVRDLRELLDRKHQELGQSNGPPADPSYNYLRDPLRENSRQETSARKYFKENSAKFTSDYVSKGQNRKKFVSRGSEQHKDEKYAISAKPTFIQSPVNIKVEIVTSTGERNCIIDRETKLADIKHVPDHTSFERRSFKNERGKNWNERGRGSRGRGTRGWARGRQQGRYHSNIPSQNKHDSSGNKFSNTAATEVSTDENWDDDCLTNENWTEDINSSLLNTEKNQENLDDATEECDENRDNIESHEGYEDDEHIPGDYYESETEHLEDQKSEEGFTKINICNKDNEKLEESIVITSSVKQDDEHKKRTVHFKDDKSPESNIDKEDTVVKSKEELKESETVTTNIKKDLEVATDTNDLCSVEKSDNTLLQNENVENTNNVNLGAKKKVLKKNK